MGSLAGLRRGAGLLARPSTRRLAQDALKKGGDDKKKAAPLIEPMWKTTAEYKTLSDLPPREVLKAELLQMAEQKNGFLFGEVVRAASRVLSMRAFGRRAVTSFAPLGPVPHPRGWSARPRNHARPRRPATPCENALCARSHHPRASRASGRTGS